LSCLNVAMLTAKDLFDFPDSLPFKAFFSNDAAPWEWVGQIKKALADFDFGAPRDAIPPGFEVGEKVYIHPSVKLPAFGVIQGPAYIGEGCELRPGVFVRSCVIAGKGSVLGNSCEFKNCLLLEGVQVPHFSYVGDSILGNNAHLGAGAICSNLRLDQKDISVQLPENGRADTGMRKLGALMGDGSEVGCNAVLNPGSILGRRALVMPTMAFRGYLAPTEMAFVSGKIKSVSRIDS